jgi:hypothetical protein
METRLLETIQKKGQIFIFEDVDEKEGVEYVEAQARVDLLGVKASIAQRKMKPWTPGQDVWSFLLDEWLRAYGLNRLMNEF